MHARFYVMPQIALVFYKAGTERLSRRALLSTKENAVQTRTQRMFMSKLYSVVPSCSVCSPSLDDIRILIRDACQAIKQNSESPFLHWEILRGDWGHFDLNNTASMATTQALAFCVEMTKSWTCSRSFFFSSSQFYTFEVCSWEQHHEYLWVVWESVRHYLMIHCADKWHTKDKKPVGGSSKCKWPSKKV